MGSKKQDTPHWLKLNWNAVSAVTMRSLLFLVGIITFVTIHELIHLLVGRSLGIPALFVNASAVGVSPQLQARYPQSSPAVAAMTGIAPIASGVMAVLTWIVLVSFGRRMPDVIRRFLGVWVVFGLPYVPLEQMLQTTNSLNSGSDFAGVIGGYFALPFSWRVLIAVAGLLLFILASFWLAVPLAVIDGITPSPHFRLSIVPMDWRRTAWRRLGGLAGALVFVGAAIAGTVKLLGGDQQGHSLLVVAAVIIAPTVAALLLPWRSLGATMVRKNWLLPATIAGMVFAIVGPLVNGNDYDQIGLFLLPQLVLAAWAQAAATPASEVTFCTQASWK